MDLPASSSQGKIHELVALKEDESENLPMQTSSVTIWFWLHLATLKPISFPTQVI